MTELNGWIAVDLDGTLADYSEWKGPEHIGAPIPLMVERVKAWLAQGKDVRIFTARIAHDENGSVAAVIERWCEEHIGTTLAITNKKDYGMVELWDDRCVQLVPNTGRRADEAVDAPASPPRVPPDPVAVEAAIKTYGLYQWTDGTEDRIGESEDTQRAYAALLSLIRGTNG